MEVPKLRVIKDDGPARDRAAKLKPDRSGDSLPFPKGGVFCGRDGDDTDDALASALDVAASVEQTLEDLQRKLDELTDDLEAGGYTIPLRSADWPPRAA